MTATGKMLVQGIGQTPRSFFGLHKRIRARAFCASSAPKALEGFGHALEPAGMVEGTAPQCTNAGTGQGPAHAVLRATGQEATTRTQGCTRKDVAECGCQGLAHRSDVEGFLLQFIQGCPDGGRGRRQVRFSLGSQVCLGPGFSFRN